MTDIELLELAAKVAGVSVVRGYFGARECWLTERPVFGLMPWDPLTNDGDALRLAFELGMSVDMGSCIIIFDDDVGNELEFENPHGDIAVVRRAIVRAAAQVSITTTGNA